MARTPAAASKIEAKALAASSKSEGMRMLYAAGYTVTQVKNVFGVGYAFAYGVAKRDGKVSTAANRRPVAQPKAKAKTQTASAPIKARATRPATATRTAKAKATRPGRPSAVRRAANRKVKSA